MINFFAPYFNKISDIVTNNFLNLVTNLTPLVNQFVTAISPSLDGIVTNISKNISRVRINMSGSGIFRQFQVVSYANQTHKKT